MCHLFFKLNALLLSILLSPAALSLSLNELNIEKDNRDSDGDISWKLKFNQKIIFKIKSIGGKPILKSIKEIQVDKNTKLYELNYDAGINGTKILFHIEKVVILGQTKSKTWKKHLEFLYKVTQQKGDKILSSESRQFYWENGRLHLGEIEGETSKTFRWTGTSLSPI